MNTPSRLVAALSCVAVIALAGCSGNGIVTAATSTAPTTGSPATSTARRGPVHQVHGSAGGVAVTLTAQGRAAVSPGGAPTRFSVHLVNSGTTDSAQLGLVVSLGHCSCNPTGGSPMPAGTMRLRDHRTEAWSTAPYVVEGTGTDFLTQTLVPPFALAHGKSATYQLELQLAPDQAGSLRAGTSALDVTLTDPTTHAAIGPSPTASLPLTVTK